MFRRSTPPPDLPAPDTPINPLGGRVHTPELRPGSRRRWAGFVAYVRPCPACGWENDESAIFCVSCAEDLQAVGPVPSTDPRPGIALVEKRMERDRRRHERSRSGEINGGGGWIIVAGVLIAATLIVNPDRVIANAIWLLAVVSAVSGIWQLRYDVKGMRAWGGALASAAVLILLLVGFRAIQASDSLDDDGESIAAAVEPTATPQTIATPVSNLVAGEVPMYQGSATHDGVMPGPAPAGTPILSWQADTGGELHAAPVLADGIVYVNGKSGVIHALDAATGNEVWRHDLTMYVTRASAAVADGVLYVGGGFSFKALDAGTGDVIWEVTLEYGGQSSPTVAGRLVIVASQQGWLYALDRASGEQVWRIPTEGLAFGAASVAGESVVYGTDEGIVYNARLENGRLNWRATVPGAVFATPVIAGDIVYITTESGEIHALSLETGRQIWRASSGSSQPPAVDGDIVVVSARDGGVYGLDAATGEQRWLFPSGRDSLTAPVIAGDLVIVGAGSSLMGLDAATGETRWYFLAGDIIESPSIVSDGHVFFGGRDGFLYALRDVESVDGS